MEQEKYSPSNCRCIQKLTEGKVVETTRPGPLLELGASFGCSIQDVRIFSVWCDAPDIPRSFWNQG